MNEMMCNKCHHVFNLEEADEEDACPECNSLNTDFIEE